MSSYANKGLCGIANVGCTCYVNTSMVCLGYCEQFVDLMMKFKDIDRGHKNSLVYECVKIVQQLWCTNSPVLNPLSFISSLRDSIKSIEIDEQNDICEFITLFIDKLNASIAYTAEIPIVLPDRSYDFRKDYDCQSAKMDEIWFKSVYKEYSELIPLFYGQSITQITCGSCNKIHHNYEIFSSLHLPLKKSSEHLKDCLNDFFKDETLNTSDNPWTCDSCNKSVPSNKMVILWKIPKVLILTIKRFKDNLEKKNNIIEIPEELDMTPHSLDLNNKNYKLVSVGCHIGSFFGGHYFALCKNKNGNWYEIDDLDVKEVKQPNLGQGYLYFYESYT